jgi:hypothetical protein
LAGSHTEHRWRCSLHKSKNRKVTKLLWETEQGLLLDPSWTQHFEQLCSSTICLTCWMNSIASKWHSANTVLEKEANIGSVYYLPAFSFNGQNVTKFLAWDLIWRQLHTELEFFFGGEITRFF